MSLGLNNFMKNLFTTKSSEYKSLLHTLQTSNPYNKIGIQPSSLISCFAQGYAANVMDACFVHCTWRKIGAAYCTSIKHCAATLYSAYHLKKPLMRYSQQTVPP